MTFLISIYSLSPLNVWCDNDIIDLNLQPLTFKSLDTKGPRHIPMEIRGPGLGQAYRCGGVTPVDVTPLIIEYKQTIRKPAQISVNSNRSHTITKMNDNINKDSTKTGSTNSRS